ncbi:Nitroreductase family protein [Pseudovibrio axinellae]|uniref:Nitroreductase family protein n=1 Tax=Pseudovibrio axinellae TaxID=989403 RepID=A0A165T636_9HYPH|nr:SagB/ThcOx family dehydrogenase [Pseudovibrio axinellae]KZL05488.1 Nitroreductase family protein [Pseudovibrio axinellae]SEP97130.1 SagB-type dehydrogenase domain-containing protein [Pseudovibrio axinellae]
MLTSPNWEKTSNKLKVSEDVFIYFKDNTPFLVDTRKHEEYEIDDPAVITEIAGFLNGAEISPETLQNFKEVNILTPETQKPLFRNFQNDILDLFHEACKDVLDQTDVCSPTEFSDAFVATCEKIDGEEPPARSKSVALSGVQPIFLPEFNRDSLNETSLFSALDRRKTIREFYPHTLSQQDLSNFLFSAFGYFHDYKKEECKEYTPFRRRSSPAGGCLQSTEAFLTVFNVEGVAPGIYWYEPEQHALLKVRDAISYEELSSLLISQYFGANCSVGVFIASNLERFGWKYQTTRAYRALCLEAGHFSQTAQLCATALGLNTWITAAFKDVRVEELLSITEERTIPLMFLGIGKGRYHPMNSIMESRLKRST